MIDWSPLFAVEARTRYFIRFGEVPKNRRSKLWTAPTVYHTSRVGSSFPGFSVFEVEKNGKRWNVVTDGLHSHGLSSLADLLYDAAQNEGRPIYLMTGTPLTWKTLSDEDKKEFKDWNPGRRYEREPLEGSDGEPLLNEHKVVKKITVADIECAAVDHDPDNLEIYAHTVEARNPVRPAVKPWNPENVDIALMTSDEYIEFVNPKGKSHPNSAYDWTLDQLNKSYEGKPHEDADSSTYDTLLQRVKANGIEFTIWLKNERRNYHEWDAEKKEYKRTPSGDLIPTTEEQIRERGYQPLDYTIGIFNPKGQRVATAQDEWGAQLIVVAREYRGFGLGALLAKFAIRFQPTKPSGGFSSGGETAYRVAHREAVRTALTTGRYAALVRSKKMTPQLVKDIVRSAGLERKTNFNRHDFGPSPRSQWLIYAEPEYGAFVLFDPKFKNLYNTGNDTVEWAESMIYGAVNAYILHDKWVIVNLLGAVDPKVKSFMLVLAASFARHERLPFYVDVDDVGALEKAKFDIADAPDLVTGMRRFRTQIKKPVDIKVLGRLSKLWLRQNDQWDELKNGILEVSHAKFRYNNAVEARVRLSLEEFLNTPHMRNENIRYKDLEIYVRKGRRHIEGRVVTTLERASTKNVRRQANMQTKARPKTTGLYREFGALCEELARQHGIEAIYVESVLNEFLPDVLRRQGYKEVPKDSRYDYGPPSFYKFVNPVVESATKTVSVREGNIFYGEDPVGKFKIEDVGPALRVSDIALQGRFQGRGIGTEVFKQWFEFADSQNKPIVLTTDAMRGRSAQARQRKLYERLGFVKNTGRTALRYGVHKIREEYVRWPKPRSS